MAGEDERQAAQNFALNYLSYRPRSRKEVYDRLRRKGYAESIVREVVEYLTERHYLDDRKFARDWADFLVNHKIVGRIFLRRELRLKGVLEDIIEEVIQDVYVSEDREKELALQLLQKRIHRYQERLSSRTIPYVKPDRKDDENFFSQRVSKEGFRMKEKKKLRQNLSNLLLRHGFSRSIIWDVLFQTLEPMG